MTRTNASPRSRNNPSADVAPFDDFLQSQIQWFDQLASLQATWLTSCLTLQEECWRKWAAGSPTLPAWMVWQNGTEQLG